MIREKDISFAYQRMLGRNPEPQDDIQKILQNRDLASLYLSLTNSSEFRKKVWDYRFFGYAAEFDPIQTILKFQDPEPQRMTEYLINFMGVGFPHASLPLQNPGDFEDLPIPANWHTDLAELGSALQVVSQCTHSFSMVELGSGIGVWSNICGRAAKKVGLEIKLVGIEGDKKHIQIAEETMKANGFQIHEYRMIHGIVANLGQFALFRKTPSSGIDWGGQPIFDIDKVVFQSSKDSGKFEVVPVISLQELLDDLPQIDLLHVDIQGGEDEIFNGNENLLKKKIKYLIIGTHTRQIEGKLFSFFLNLGFKLLCERPLIGKIEDGKLHTTVDGVQFWSNTSLN